MKKKDLYREELEKIRVRDGMIRPEVVVEDARAKDHPMHSAFEWDNKKCGEYWRVHQARMLINTIMVEVMDVGMSAYEVVIPVEDKGRKGYYSVEQIMSDDELRKQVLRNALKLIKYWRGKYMQYKELEGIINEKKLQEVEDTVK